MGPIRGMPVTSRVHDILAAQLAEDEQVLWTGRPAAWAFVTRNWMLSVVGLFWLALTLMWTAGVAAGGLPLPFYFVVAPLLAIAGWMILGHAAWAAIELPNVQYVLTNWRVLMTYGWLRTKVRTIPLGKIAELDLCPRAGGYGDIRLGLELGFWDGARWARAGVSTWGSQETVLRGVPACATVYAQLTQAIRAGGTLTRGTRAAPPATR